MFIEGKAYRLTHGSYGKEKLDEPITVVAVRKNYSSKELVYVRLPYSYGREKERELRRQGLSFKTNSDGKKIILCQKRHLVPL